MYCKFCGKDTGRYHLCLKCLKLKEDGLIKECPTCQKYHWIDEKCGMIDDSVKYNYNPQKLLSDSELVFFSVIKASVPTGYYVFPQVNLAAFIKAETETRYHNELFRNVDFLVADSNFNPRIAIEINDRSHLEKDRKIRDQKVSNICEEAGIPLIKLWTSYGANQQYISNKIKEALTAPIQRVKHSKATSSKKEDEEEASFSLPGCYIATCVYGSYDCPQVWTLRRYRDYVLAETWYGRAFIKMYYAVSPKLVKLFGKQKWFKNIFKRRLDKMVKKLKEDGFLDTPYNDLI